MNRRRIAVITGGSNGIGLSTVKFLALSGAVVYEISRSGKNSDYARHITADVTDESAIKNAVNQIISAEGHIDILITCAGFGVSGAVEFTELNAAKKQLDVNFFGTVNTVKAVLPAMREQGYGRIVCISSVAAAIAIPFQTYYSVSKAAINSYVSALRNEIRPYGISICSVMPGDIKTGFTASREKSHAGDAEYGRRIAKSVAVMEKDEQNGMNPDTAGKFIADVAMKKHIRVLYTIGIQYKFFVWLSRFLPNRLVSRIVYMMYAK